MSTHHLQLLCEGFCEIAHVALPELREQHDGIVAFSVLWHNVTVDVMARPAADPHNIFVLFDLGLPDLSRADLSQVLLALLQSNFMAMRANQPVFSCHPETGTVVLQWAMPLADTRPTGLHQVIQEGVSLARLWRQDYFLASPATADGAANALPTDTYA
jgi:hypothetical protein